MKKFLTLLCCATLLTACGLFPKLEHHKAPSSIMQVTRPIQIKGYFATKQPKKGFKRVPVTEQGDSIYIFAAKPIFNLDQVVTVGIDRLDEKYYVRLTLVNFRLKQIRLDARRDRRLGYVITLNDKIISMNGLVGERAFLFRVKDRQAAEEIKQMILEDTSVMAE